MSECLSCGSCCNEISPFGNPCPYVKEVELGLFLCSIYSKRPKACRDHTFDGRWCPIGLSILKPERPSDLHRRSDRIYELTSGVVLI